MEEENILEIYQEFEDYFKSFLGFSPYNSFEKKYLKFLKEKKSEEGQSLANGIKNFKNSLKLIQKSILENLDIPEEKLVDAIDHLLIIDKKKYNPISLSNDNLRIDLDQIVSFNQADLIRALIAEECLENFLHESIKDQPFLKAMVFHKLIYSKKPLNEVERTALLYFWKTQQPEIESNIQKNYLKHYYNFLGSLVLPQDKIDIAFRIHIRSFNNYQQHLIRGDKNLPVYLDALIDENLAEYRTRMITRDFIYFLFDINELFNKLKIPFTVNHFKTIYHVESEKYSSFTPDYINNLSLINNYWNKIPEIGGGFSYNGHWEHFGVSYYLIIFQLSSDSVKLEDLLKKLPFCARSCSFLSGQQKEIYFLYFYYLKNHKQALQGLFDSLQNFGLIRFYMINELKSINEFCTDIYADVIDQTRITYNSTFIVKDNPEIYDIDLFDMFLLEELRYPITGFALRTNEDMALKIQDRIRNINMDLLVELGNIDYHSKEIQAKVEKPEIYFPYRVLANKMVDVSYSDIMNTYLKKLGVIGTNYMISRFINMLQLFLDLKTEGVNISESLKIIQSGQIIQFHGPILKILIELKKNITELNKFFKVLSLNINLPDLLQLWIEYNEELVNLIISNDVIPDIERLRSIEFLTSYSNYKDRRSKLIPLVKKIQEDYLSLDINAITIKALSRLGYFKKKEIISPNFLYQMGGANPYFQKIIFLNTIIDENLIRRIQILGKISPFGYFNEFTYFNKSKTINLVYLHFYFKDGMQYFLDELINFLFPSQIYFMTTIFERDTFLFHYFTLYNPKINQVDLFNESIEDFKRFSETIRLMPPNSSNEDPNLLEDVLDSMSKDPISLGNIPESTQKHLLKRISEYYNQIKVLKNQKNLSDLLAKISEIFKILNNPDIINEILNNNNRFYLDPIKKISYKTNWQYFGMDAYIFQFKFGKNKDTIENRTKLMIPGTIKIERSIDAGYFQNIIFHYILPNNQIPAKLINYFYSHNIISRFRLMKIKKLLVSFNPQFTFGENEWKSSYRSLDILADNLIHDSKYFNNFTPHLLEYNFEYLKNRTFSNESSETSFIRNFLDLDLRKLVSLKHLEVPVNNLIAEGIIKPYIELNTDNLKLFSNEVWYISPITPEIYQSILYALSLLPYCQIYEVETLENDLIKTNLNPNLSFFVYVFLPNSRINELYLKMSNIFSRFKIEKFEWISDIKEESARQFTVEKVIEVVHPFESHILQKNKWQLIDHFDNKGVPLSYFNRIKQIKGK